MTQVTISPKQAKGALTKAGGYIGGGEGYTHTFQPYTGCAFGCEYCYVKHSRVHFFHQPRLAWGDYVDPRQGIDRCLEKELKRFAAKGKLDGLSIFMSSVTDPYQGQERTWRLSRACLEVMAEYPPGLLVIQTRSPLVQDDFPLIRRLGDRCWLSFSIETDLDDVRRLATPQCAAIGRRWETLSAALELDLNVQITVSPCLPFSDVATFGERLLRHSHRVVVDTYISGDGQGGTRTAKTDIPVLYEDMGWGDWRDEGQAIGLYQWLRERIGERAGWSQAGFTALPRLLSFANNSPK